MSLPRYPKYKDSGVEWLGEVPEHWEVRRVKHVLRSMGSGGTPDTDDAEFWSTTDGVPWVAIGDMSERDHVDATAKCLTTAGVDSKRLAVWPSGTLLFSMYASLGHVAELRLEATINQAILALVPNQDVFQSFLKRWFEFLRPGLREHASSNTQDNLNAGKVRNLPVVCPPIPEQVYVAAFLDSEAAKVDALVAEQERLIDLLKEKRQAVISHAVTKGLNPDAPMKESGIDWMGPVPEQWVVAGLTKYVDSVVDYRGRTPTKVDDGICLVTARNIRHGRIDYAISEECMAADEYDVFMRRGRPELGDVLFTTEAPLGQVANVDRTDIALAQRIIKFRGQAGVLNNFFLKYWMMGAFCQADMDRLATGSTALGIKGSKVVQLRLCLPPYEEQTAIVFYLDRELDRLDALTAEARRAIGLLQERRAALISAAVTGQIDVRPAAARRPA